MNRGIVQPKSKAWFVTCSKDIPEDMAENKSMENMLTILKNINIPGVGTLTFFINYLNKED